MIDRPAMAEPAPSPADQALIESLAAEEFADFAPGAISPEFGAAELALAHEQILGVILFELRAGELGFVIPAAGPNREFWEASEDMRWRTWTYRAFLAAALPPALPPALRRGHSFFGLFVGDGHQPTAGTPLFCFQKPRGANNLALPDIDFLGYGFYHDLAPDPWPLERKLPKAAFAGSTTGAHVTHEAIDTLSHPRLRSFAHFRNSAVVDYRLPNIAMVAEEGVEERLRAMGIGLGPRVSWEDQLRHRFLLSMDGNGATCSRLYKAPRSNSVLVKYASASTLFYFRRLEPWAHYIPVGSDAEAEAVVRHHAENLPLLRRIVAGAHAFAARYLTEPALRAYAAALLARYAALAPERMTPHLLPRLERALRPGPG